MAIPATHVATSIFIEQTRLELCLVSTIVGVGILVKYKETSNIDLKQS